MVLPVHGFTCLKGKGLLFPLLPAELVHLALNPLLTCTQLQFDFKESWCMYLLRLVGKPRSNCPRTSFR